MSKLSFTVGIVSGMPGMEEKEYSGTAVEVDGSYAGYGCVTFQFAPIMLLPVLAGVSMAKDDD